MAALWQAAGPAANPRTTARTAALEALTPAVATQLTGLFPLSIVGMWKPGSSRSGKRGQQQSSGQSQPRLGPDEPLPVLGLHWLDQDVLAAVCQQGLSAVLLVLESSTLEVRVCGRLKSGSHVLAYML